MERTYTGSRAFFEGMEGFKPYDTDYVSFASLGTELCHRKFGKESEFIWDEGLGKDGIFNYLKERPTLYNAFCVFLVPNVIEYLDVTIDDLKVYEPYIAQMDYRHQYLHTICQCYIKNGKFMLTQEQRAEAFEKYKTTRL